uniref:TRAP transporter substrate-binding protein n=1 Tax=Agathobacter sp. TaxID=2021311 RepID=UPI004056A3F1
MEKLIRCIYILLLFCGVCTGIYFVKAQKKEVVPDFVLTYAENHPPEYPTTKGALKFAELVEERTNGKIQIQIKHSGEYGTQQQMVNQMKFGGIDFARVSLSSVSDELPQLNVLQLPFLYEDADHMWRVLDSEIGKDCLQVFTQIGLVGLSWYDAGARSFYSRKKPIYSCEDIFGMSIRVQESKMMQDMIAVLGGTPVDLAYTEVYSAFEQDQIDAAENSWPSYEFSKHYEVASYFTADEHTRVPEIQLMSEKTWKKLSNEYQRIICECALESAEYEKMLWWEREELSRKEALENGCQEIILAPEELEKFRQKMVPLYEKYCSGYMEVVEQIMEMGKQ